VSEVVEAFRAMAALSQQKRAANRAAAPNLLTQAGVQFTSNNLGAHLVVVAGAFVVDFWPGTGLWIVRGAAARRRGVFGLLDFIARVAQKGGAS